LSTIAAVHDHPAMTESPSAGLRYAIDRLVVKGRRVFGWGWVAHATRGVKSLHVRVAGDGWERRLPVSFGIPRPDVGEAHAALVNASSAGYVLTGYLPSTPARAMRLEVELDDGTRAECDIAEAIDHRAEPRDRLRVLAWLARAVWRRLRHGDIAGIVRRARAQHYAAPSVDDISILDTLVPLARKARALAIVFDNNMGGGSNHYRRMLIAERVAAGETVLLCTYNLPILEYRLHLIAPGEEERVFAASTFEILERVLDQVEVREVFVNSPVSFDEPLILADWLARMREEHPATRLTISAHDYFAICPSFVLLNAEGRYCGIPSLAECSVCLKCHQAPYVALAPPSEIGTWRTVWGQALAAADEIRCFSQATRAHFLRAYPSLDPRRLTVVPHKPDYVPQRLPRVNRRAPLVIGVVGEITEQKGARIVTGMADEIDRAGLDVRVVVIGTLAVAHESPSLTVTGAYQRKDLVDLIEAHGINMFLFPSIWPETFSYVVAEMIALELPIVAFDLGAPGERLARHPLARIAPEVGARPALATAVDFHRALALGRASSAAA
jgi:glycosyltransferase involved in cell wall biosynthesis